MALDELFGVSRNGPGAGFRTIQLRAKDLPRSLRHQMRGDKIFYPLGEHAAGYVTITPTRFWLLFVDSTRRSPASPTLTDAEAIAMMKTQVAWTGRYTTAEQTAEGLKITAHVDAASSQALFNTDRVYVIRVAGNKMTVKSPGVIVPMTGQTSVVEFELTKSD